MDIEIENKRIFHAIIENEAVNKIGYGTITFSIRVENGNPLINTLRVDRMKRKKYNLKKDLTANR
ncbi:hypothetical protein A2377_00800 [Candidatus Roizmanbacteria bacterium RIFOXYB1_FULL_41_27]|nr:MAG: hypothetical protein A2377_00800 [Candidatus Roizmanbacteria bacterium RIFOXYB1_FULL_41_27]